MRKILAILTALLLVSCSLNHDEVVVSMKQNVTTKISQEQALKNLYGELNIIDGETRADGTTRKVKSIEPLVGAKTRSGNALDNDLLYIVEFEEGQGSAVLAADTRLDPVIAVLDTDVLTAEDFASDDMDDISAYMASMIGEYANYAANSRSGGLLPAPGHTVVDTIYTANIPPMLKTKWHQGSPYNDLCIRSNGNNADAGCGTIAIAQLVYYYKSPSVINGYTVNWDDLALCEYKYTGPEFVGGELIGPRWTVSPGSGVEFFNPGDVEVAKFVYNIGMFMGLDYYNNDISAPAYKMIPCLATFGYNSTYKEYNLVAIKNMVANYKPVIMTGERRVSAGIYVGHGWLIDGWKDYVIRTTTASEVEGEVGTVVPEYTITETYYDKIHCNFGWGGDCDGYYTGDIFDCYTPNYDIEPGTGDTAHSTYGQYIYAYNFHYYEY